MSGVLRSCLIDVSSLNINEGEPDKVILELTEI